MNAFFFLLFFHLFYFISFYFSYLVSYLASYVGIGLERSENDLSTTEKDLLIEKLISHSHFLLCGRER